MRAANIVVVGLGLVSVAIAGSVSWNWRQLPLHARSATDLESNWRDRFRDAARTVGAAFSAGAIAGVLVLGLVGRLVMRILGATSSRAQGSLTEAGETVGEITSGGTIGFLLFVGLLGGIVSAAGYLIIRSWLPTKAGSAGLVFGILMIGTLGVSDALSPSNIDFAILEPLWLAILLVVSTGFLFATTFTAVAARFDRLAQTPGRRGGLLYPVFVLGVAPPVAVALVAHIGIRTFAGNTLFAFTQSARVRVVGRIMLTAGTIATAYITTNATIDILTA